MHLYPFPKQQILDTSELKEFANDNLKFDGNSKKFSKWVENTVWKGEIGHNEQFLLFTQYFQKTCIADTWKPGLVWERVNPFPHNDTFWSPLGNKPFENTVGKGEIARNKQFLLFPQCFLPV